MITDFFSPAKAQRVDAMRARIQEKRRELIRALDEDSPTARELAHAVLEEIRGNKGA